MRGEPSSASRTLLLVVALMFAVLEVQILMEKRKNPTPLEYETRIVGNVMKMVDGRLERRNPREKLVENTFCFSFSSHDVLLLLIPC